MPYISIFELENNINYKNKILNTQIGRIIPLKSNYCVVYKLFLFDCFNFQFVYTIFCRLHTLGYSQTNRTVRDHICTEKKFVYDYGDNIMYLSNEEILKYRQAMSIELSDAQMNLLNGL